jgi:pyruvate dehydrogenase E2 component (dihydrolipoamide acetyltransferase)
MAAYLEMPKLSDTMTEGRVVKWRKKPGENVEVGEVLAEIETDKAVMDMEAFEDGVLGEILVPEGESAKIGQKLAAFRSSNGDTDLEEGAETGTPAAAQMREMTEQPAQGKAPPAAPVAAQAKPSGGRLKASPLAKKIAAERGIDLHEISGTGPGGRIIARDVQGGKEAGTAAAARPVMSQSVTGAAPARPASQPQFVQPLAPGEVRRIPLTSIRKTVADRLLASKTTIPHFYLNIEVDAAPLLQLRVMLNQAAEQQQLGKITINDLVVKAVAMAAQRVPQVNASFTGSEIIEYPNVDIAVAVAIDDGLITPILRQAEKLSIREISRQIKDLAERARTRKLKLEEFQGGTITVSNLGGYGIDRFSAIINPPQALIVSVGAVVKKPVVNDADQIVAGHRMDIGISADHRVVDGAVGAKFLAELRRVIEVPAMMLL